MMSSPGSTVRSARTTVSPPTPESNTPMGQRLYVLSCPIERPGSRRPVTPGQRKSQGNYRLANENALRALTLPRTCVRFTCRFVCPDKLQKRRGFIVELSVEPADAGKAALGHRKLAF